MKMKFFRVGLTGRVASGKSAAAKFFSALGVPVIDLEPLARAASGTELLPLERLVERFGPSILTACGHLNPPVLRQIVFSQPRARIDLEALTRACLSAQMVAHSSRAGGPYQVLAIPLLLQESLGAHLNRVLVVDSGEKSPLHRGDFDVITHNGDVNAVRDQVTALHARYLALARQLRNPQDNSGFS